MKLSISFTIGTCMMLLTACGDMPTFKSFEQRTPKLDIRNHFNGDLEAWGFLQDRGGEVTRRFNVKMNGSWQGNVGTLKESFTFDDNEKQQRTWTINVVDKNSFTGTAEDVIGVAQGKQLGNAINMKYVLRIPVDETTYDIKVNDWLILLDDKRLMNISSLSKLGFNVGRLTIFFEKK